MGQPDDEVDTVQTLEGEISAARTNYALLLSVLDGSYFDALSPDQAAQLDRDARQRLILFVREILGAEERPIVLNTARIRRHLICLVESGRLLQARHFVHAVPDAFRGAVQFSVRIDTLPAPVQLIALDALAEVYGQRFLDWPNISSRAIDESSLLPLIQNLLATYQNGAAPVRSGVLNLFGGIPILYQFQPQPLARLDWAAGDTRSTPQTLRALLIARSSNGATVDRSRAIVGLLTVSNDSTNALATALLQDPSEDIRWAATLYFSGLAPTFSGLQATVERLIARAKVPGPGAVQTRELLIRWACSLSKLRGNGELTELIIQSVLNWNSRTERSIVLSSVWSLPLLTYGGKFDPIDLLFAIRSGSEDYPGRNPAVYIDLYIQLSNTRLLSFELDTFFVAIRGQIERIRPLVTVVDGAGLERYASWSKPIWLAMRDILESVDPASLDEREEVEWQITAGEIDSCRRMTQP